MADLYVALVHSPVYGREKRIVTSSVTNIDVHDISRSCRTYGVRGFFVVTPVEALQALVRRIMVHWDTGPGRDYNPTRTEALALARLAPSIEAAEAEIERETGQLPVHVATSARLFEGSTPFEEHRKSFDQDGPPQLLLLGTAWGLTDETMERAAVILPPICGPTDYNHLSVRAAAAILLDRLRGTR